jgi:putative tricarboxylic transport membrane protein
MKNLSDILASLVLILIASGAIIGAIGLRIGTPTEPQPGFFPFLSGAVILVLSLVILFRGFAGRTGSRQGFGEIRRPAMLVGVLIVFVVLLESLGFILASLIAIVLVLRIMGLRSWRVLLISAFAFSIGTFLLFDRLLGIPLPAGVLAPLGL